MARKTNTTKGDKFKDQRIKASVSLDVSVVPDENPRNLWGIFDGDFTNPTPDELKYYLESWRKGFFFWGCTFIDFIRRRDLFIKSVCLTRKLPITAKEWIIEGDDSNKEAAEYFTDLFTYSDWFIQFLADCAEANISGVSLFEINYGMKDNKIIPEEIKTIPLNLCLYHDQLKKYLFLDITKCDGNKLKMIGRNMNTDRIEFNLLETIELDELKLLEVHALDGTAANGILNGHLDGIVWAYLRKNYAKKDFAMFLEKWADPPVSASYENYMNNEGRTNAKKAVDAYGNAKKIVHSKDIEFKVHDEAQKAATTDLFMQYINDEKEDISIAILGQTLTTKIGDKGSYAAANVHETVRQDLQHADMIIVSKAVNQLIKRLCLLNYPGIKPPVFKFVSQVDIDFKKSLAVIVRDLRIAGFKPVAEELSKTFGFTLEETTPVGGAVDPNMEGADDTAGKKDEGADDNKTDDDTKTLSMPLDDLISFAKAYNKADKEKKIKMLLDKIFQDSKPEEVKEK